MGEGERDRLSKRQKSSYGIDKSSSDTELARGKNKNRRQKSKEKWPFVEGISVDELARFRRKKIKDQPKDTLGLSPTEELSPNIVTEYRRAFCADPDDTFDSNKSTLRTKRSENNLQPDELRNTQEPIENQSQLESNSNNPEQLPSNLSLTDGQGIMETEVDTSKLNANLIKSSLKKTREENFYTNTENSLFIPHEGFHRPELMRRPTSLKMEGDMETMTEKCEKFIEWLNVSRPELIRLPTHLKLEGDLETTTECHDSYIPFVGVKRPELLKQTSHLKLEGEARFLPEYSAVFKEYDFAGRPSLKKPESNLRAGGDFYQSTEANQQFMSPRSKDVQLMAELVKDLEDKENKMRDSEKDEEKIHKKEEMKMLVSKLEDLKGPPLEIPEYKAAYKDFPRERPKLLKPEDEIGRADGSKIASSPVHIKFSSKIDQDPEYKSIYLDLSRERPLYRKPPLSLRPSVILSSGRTSANASRMSFHEPKRHHDLEPTSEVRSQYISYGQIPRVETLRMPANLRLEGNLDLEPEYKNAYCSRPSLNVFNEPRMHRHRERSLSASRKKDNYWVNNNNSEQFGRINAADDQDAFQILSTRVHEESIVGKPPSGSRRGSRASLVPRPSIDVADHSIMRNRSPSPTYRLHVCNVDVEPKGFNRRKRSPSLPSSEKINVTTTHDIDDIDDCQRPYSPSFAKDSRRYSDNNQAFVVLDHDINDSPKINNNNINNINNANETRRRRTDSNFTVDSLSSVMPRGRPRNKTPPNWMPPWYDSSSSIIEK
ncbi:uncharacterized protein LOC127286117 [Leptopilina boulardi]|uniref:uncharacterized protein LOC127286117 n=1 Tax=Leptopilina boulardi TaxID=63433 RepID=UPI0021F58ECC|nr:uncharacterized protein LOC127286117 [Leptopilina boulardi]